VPSLKNKKTIALCIPAYNAAAYLPRLLRSAASQKIPFDEILVYNDCSADNTAEVAEAHGAKVISGKRNVGCSAGKNALLRECSSEWIHFHDADDELLPNFTTLAHKWLTQDEMPDVLLFNYEYRDNETKKLITLCEFFSERLRSDPVEYAILTQINPFCGLYRKKRLQEVGGYDLHPDILYNEDVAFHCKLAIAGLTFDVEPEVSIINFRISGSMSSANQVRCLKAQHAVMRRVATQVGARYHEAIAQRLWAISSGLAVHGEWGEMDRALELSFSLLSKAPYGQSRWFSKLAIAVSPKIAFRVREILIRLFKPYLRKK
jgi:glycosyltransferase involved in cell wall biosynthesis